MTRTRNAKIALAIAGSSSAAMGAYHFFLPSMFHWDRFVTKVPDSIQWALFSINFFFSYLLLAGVGTFFSMASTAEISRTQQNCARAVETIHKMRQHYGGRHFVRARGKGP